MNPLPLISGELGHPAQVGRYSIKTLESQESSSNRAVHALGSRRNGCLFSLLYLTLICHDTVVQPIP